MDKFAANRKRDAVAVSSLERAGWEVVVVWECETEDPQRLKNRLVAFLEDYRDTRHPART